MSSTRITNLPAFSTFLKTVTTAGTPVQLTSGQVLPDGIAVLIKAKKTNTGEITVGNSSANALNTSGTCFRLSAGESISIQLTNANLIWIDSTVNGEGVEVLTETLS